MRLYVIHIIKKDENVHRFAQREKETKSMTEKWDKKSVTKGKPMDFQRFAVANLKMIKCKT